MPEPTQAPTIETPTRLQPFTVSVKVSLDAIVLPEADGRFSVVVPALPGCVTCGDTVEEVLANVVEAAEGWLETQHEHRKDDELKAMTDPLPGEANP